MKIKRVTKVPHIMMISRCSCYSCSQYADVPLAKVKIEAYYAIFHMEISPDHPRYHSLLIREQMARLVHDGVVAPTGLIAHGRGEAFDYLLGERTTANALRAEKVVAAYLLQADRPVITVNGNAAGLCGKELIQLAEAIPAKLEVNLFHRTPERMGLVIDYLIGLGATSVLGREQNAQLSNIASDRAMCSKDGILVSDTVLIPLEDGDRAGALVKAGKELSSYRSEPSLQNSKGVYSHGR